MSFFIDKQTLEDLNIAGRYKSNSVFRIFDSVTTLGGRKLLEEMFLKPLTSMHEINARSGLFKAIAIKELIFPFTGEEISILDNYLIINAHKTVFNCALSIISMKVKESTVQSEELDILKKSIDNILAVLRTLKIFLDENLENESNAFDERFGPILTILADQRFKEIFDNKIASDKGLVSYIRYHQLFCVRMGDTMKKILVSVHLLDVLITVSAVGRTKGFSYATALEKKKNILVIEGLFHPSLVCAVSNNLSFEAQKGMMFLTGANMAGKSTLMKAVGIAFYLAHAGFPVPATKMEFSPKDGIFTSINVPDSLENGYSHFYAEVLRVKSVAEKISRNCGLLVIFDELFKGTNVKDAYDGTLAITTALSNYSSSFFMISTHITEVGEELMKESKVVQYKYLPTEMQNGIPRYAYKLQSGISSDRQGMLIIENEGILNILGSDV